MPLRRKRSGADTGFPGAAAFIPDRVSIGRLREAARGCHGCALYQHATQTVFGEGRTDAEVVLIGEQPGNDEDLQGHPFVGPAGRILDEALTAAGLSREKLYVTNVVKHFKWEPRGKRRMHSRPRGHEIKACLPWLQQELALIRPKLVVCLGATAAQALLGRSFRVTEEHGKPFGNALVPAVMATVHPSSVLRQPTPEARAEAMQQLVGDLKAATRLLNQTAKKS